MQQATLSRVRTQESCSSGQYLKSFTSSQGVSGGKKLIEQILKGDFFCRHDIALLDHQFSRLSNEDHENVLKQIILKIEKIASILNVNNDPITNAKNLLALYYFRNFSAKDLHIEKPFSIALTSCGQDPLTVKMVATHLPTCGSEIEFHDDATFFVGPEPSEDIAQILREGREELRNYTKNHLKKLREDDPNNFPQYLEVLLNEGHVHLVDHLIQMKKYETRIEKEKAIRKMTCSYASHVILEMRKAIIQKVQTSISDQPHKYLFLLGGSGAGKSTTLCFLRGDEMVLNGKNYESKKDGGGLIGNIPDASCTFFPNVEVTEDWVIVDFPGFDDTNGSLISLGMECALKALVERYRPRIMVVESITNTEGRLVTAAHLGERLKRLLDNKEHCVLGLTKYSYDPDFKDIQTIENNQRREFETPSPDESSLTGEISIIEQTIAQLISLKQESLQFIITQNQEQLTQKKQKLGEIQLTRVSQSKDQLLDTDKKTKHKNVITGNEERLLKQIGLGQILRFDNLENQSLLHTCYSVFSEATILSTNPTHILDAEHEKLIVHIFENDLIGKTESVSYDLNQKNFDDFERSVKETSLFNTLFSWAKPETGEFLHLPELDPRIVRSFDKTIVENCINRFIESLINGLDIPPPDTLAIELRSQVSEDKIDRFTNEYTRLRDYVMVLRGIDLGDLKTQEKIEETWNETRKKVQASVDGVDNEFVVDYWVKALMIIPLGIPLGIQELIKWRKKVGKERETIEEIVDNECGVLAKMHETLKKLKELEALIKYKESVLKSIQRDGLALKDIDENLKRNKEIVIIAVTQNGLALQYASNGLKEDREVVLSAVRQNGLALEYANVIFKTDVKVVTAAVEQNGLAIQYVDLEAIAIPLGFLAVYLGIRKIPKEVVLKAVIQNGLALQYVCEWCDNYDVVLAAVKQNGLALQYAASHLRTLNDNSDDMRSCLVVNAAITQNPFALQYVHVDLENSERLYYAAVSCALKRNGLVLQYVHKTLRAKKEVVLIAVAQNGLALQYADRSLKANREVVLTAVGQNGLALEYAEEEIRQDEEIRRVAMSRLKF